MVSGNVFLKDRQDAMLLEIETHAVAFFKKGVLSMYEHVKKANTQRTYLLKEFQHSLKNISKWSDEVKELEWVRFKNNTKKDVEKLIEGIFKVSSIILKGFKDNELAPSGMEYVYECYLNIARALWKDPYIIYDIGVSSEERHRRITYLEKVIAKCIRVTFIEMIKVDPCVDGDDLDDDENVLEADEESESDVDGEDDDENQADDDCEDVNDGAGEAEAEEYVSVEEYEAEADGEGIDEGDEACEEGDPDNVNDGEEEDVGESDSEGESEEECNDVNQCIVYEGEHEDECESSSNCDIDTDGSEDSCDGTDIEADDNKQEITNESTHQKQNDIKVIQIKDGKSSHIDKEKEINIKIDKEKEVLDNEIIEGNNSSSATAKDVKVVRLNDGLSLLEKKRRIKEKLLRANKDSFF